MSELVFVLRLIGCESRATFHGPLTYRVEAKPNKRKLLSTLN